MKSENPGKGVVITAVYILTAYFRHQELFEKLT